MKCRKFISALLCVMLLSAPLTASGCFKIKVKLPDDLKEKFTDDSSAESESESAESEKITSDSQKAESEPVQSEPAESVSDSTAASSGNIQIPQASVVKSKPANVCSFKPLDLPDNFQIDYNGIFVTTDKAYLTGYEITDKVNYITAPAIIEMNKDGSGIKKHMIEPPACLNSDYPGMQFEINNLCISSDENIISVIMMHNADYSEENYHLIKSAFDGRLILNIDIESLIPESSDGSYFYINQIIEDSENFLYICVSRGEEQFIIVLNPDGSESFSIETNGWIERMVKTDSGIIISHYNYSENSESESQTINLIDKASRSLKKVDYIPEGLGTGYSIRGGSGYDMYISNSVGLYGINSKNPAPEKIADWINSCIYPLSINNICAVDKSHFLCSAHTISETSDSKMPKAFILYPAPEKDIKETYPVSLGYLYPYNSIPEFIIDFNKKNNDYRIEVRDYSVYNQGNNFELSAGHMKNDIVNGTLPDITMISGDTLLKEMLDHAHFADLYEFMDNDPDFSRESILPGVRSALEYNGKLYNIPTVFVFQTLTGKNQNIGGKSSWTMKDAVTYAENLPEGSAFISTASRGSLPFILMDPLFSYFIDYKNKTCSFDSQEFIQMINYGASLGDYNDIYSQNYEDAGKPYREDSIMLSQSYIGSFEMYLAEKIMFGLDENINMIGYPRPDGRSGGAILAYDTLAISDNSPVKEGAWEFIKFMLSYQTKTNGDLFISGFPVTVKEFDRIAEQKMNEKLFFFKNGGFTTIDDPEYSSMEDGIYLNLTQKDVDDLKNYINSASHNRSYSDLNIGRIIVDEYNKFLDGKVTSAEKTAESIQKQVSAYLNKDN